MGVVSRLAAQAVEQAVHAGAGTEPGDTLGLGPEALSRVLSASERSVGGALAIASAKTPTPRAAEIGMRVR